MIEALAVSNAALWVAVVLLLVAVLALARQIGVLYERVAPMGALMLDDGPRVGEAAPELDLTDLSGRPVHVGGASRGGTLLFFVSPTCPVCKKLLPIVRAAARAERDLALVLASDGDAAEHAAFVRRAGLGNETYVLSTELGMRWRVGKLPHAVLIDARGMVRAKGLVNSREQVESLFTARELGVASIQDYVDQRA
jgi:methylamine dehydrogenase accessory protein MauD